MTPPEANQQALSRLAYLLRRRHARASGRDFVVLAVDRGAARANSDDQATQQLPVMRLAR